MAVIKGGLHCEELRLGPVEQPQTTEVEHASPPYPVRLLLQLRQVFSYRDFRFLIPSSTFCASKFWRIFSGYAGFSSEGHDVTTDLNIPM